MVISSHQSFILRTLIIHEYRRILLKDHELPEELLPDNWSGFGASQVVKSLYAHLAESSCEYITTQLYNANGFLPVAEKDFNFRFRE